MKKEPTRAAQWIYFPGLQLMLYMMDYLQIIASWFGKFLGIENATSYHTHASGARICVKVDLLEEPVQGFLFH